LLCFFVWLARLDETELGKMVVGGLLDIIFSIALPPEKCVFDVVRDRDIHLYTQALIKHVTRWVQDGCQHVQVMDCQTKVVCLGA
jgi:hypothetical protein